MARSFADFGSPQNGPWTKTLPLGPRIFDFYKSQGDLVVPATGLAVPNSEDGPITISRYRRLEINGAFTKEHRDRGWCILCDDLVLGAGARPNMEGKGAAGSPKWAIQDITIPSYMTLYGRHAQYDDFAAWLRENGYAVFDPSLFAAPLPGMPDVQANYADWPSSGPVLVSAAGCGAASTRRIGVQIFNAAPAYYGSYGHVGVQAPGGGGGGGGQHSFGSTGAESITGTVGSRGFPWSGGVGGGTSYVLHAYVDSNYAQTEITDGDGDPYTLSSSYRPGGLLIILVRNSIIATTGHSISANATSQSSGAGHGAGRVFLGYGGTLTGTLSMTATGGAASAYCGPGGAGAVTAQTFAQMGWS